MASLNAKGYCYLISPLNGDHTNIPVDCSNGGEKGVDYWGGRDYLRAITQEGLGTFMFVLLFLSQTDEKMLFSRERAINCFIIASSYVAARAMFYGQATTVTTLGAVLNPAIALGIMLGATFNGVNVGAGGAIMIWFIYPLMPIAGSILSIVFFEFVYKKTQETLEGDFKEEHNDDGLLDA